METETLEQTFDKYMKGKIESKEKRMGLILKSKIPEMKAGLTKRMYDELVKAGFGKKDALTIICSGIMEV